jgi:peptidoglycan-N-acetylglucosamine deacetylase
MDSSEKKIYLTFDDGPIPVVTPFVLRTLKEENIKATFFCVGANVAHNPDIYKMVLDDGHTVGNHTYNHLNGWDTDTNKYIANVKQCSELVNSKLFRPPYGKLKRAQIAQLTSPNSILPAPYSIIMWDVLSGDYDLKTGKRQCVKNVCDNLRNGSIVLFHDSIKAREKLEYALPRFIKFAKEEGYAFGVLG